jgi:uncharacterized membrane protein
MDCYFHHAVPSVARCSSCGKSVCTTCRAETGDCPSCRFAARIDEAAAQRQGIAGGVGPSSGPAASGPAEEKWYGGTYGPSTGTAAAPHTPTTAVATLRPESRALVALGYPFWPLALIALLDSGKSEFVRRNALQALGFNAGMYGLGALFTAIASIPLIGLPAIPLMMLMVPVTVIASVVYGYRVWHGDDVHVPFVSDAIDGSVHRTT